MGTFNFDNFDLTLDEDTALRLMAICAMYRAEEGKDRAPADIIHDTIARLHEALVKGRPNYVKAFTILQEQKTRHFEEKNAAPPPALMYPNDFVGIDTGIESIFLKRKYGCPMCQNAFTAPALKTGSLLVKLDNRTQMDVYTGVRADSDKEFVDYSLFHIMICPNCLYAGQEKDFDLWDAGSKDPQWIRRKRIKLQQKVLTAFLDDLNNRRRVAQKAGDQGLNLFSSARNEGDAAIAIELATYTLNFLISRVNANHKAELIYQTGLLNLMKSLQYEKQLDDPMLSSEFPTIRKKRLESIRDALASFLQVPDSTVENLDVRESVRFNARKFWAAHELKHAVAFAAAGGALQRTFNQYVSQLKKAEREYQIEEDKLKRLGDDQHKAKNIQQKEQVGKQMKEVEKNLQLLRAGMENYRGVVRVVTPIYDSISLYYDKFREMQRQRKRELAADS